MMTMSQKILAKKCGKDSVSAGELICTDVDLVLSNDITGPIAINEFEKMSANGKFANRDKIVFVMDHFTPNKDIKSAENCKKIREFSVKHGIKNFYEGGCAGIEHALLPEKGHIKCGELIIGADSHTCTYGALNAFSTGMGSTDIAAAMQTGRTWLKVPSGVNYMIKGKFNNFVSGKDLILDIIGKIGVDGALYKSMEFTGDTQNLSIDDKFTISNMVVEAGAKNGIFQADQTIVDYLKNRTDDDFEAYTFDPNAKYEKSIEINLADIVPNVAFPNIPSNVKDIYTAEKLNIKIDQVVIGSCTNGRYGDLEAAAKILNGKKVAKNVRVIIIPATPEIYSKAMENGLLKIFLDAGCVISAPTCGPCLGGHTGILAAGERCVSTTNRNFVGRMGHEKSEVYLASPVIAAISAVSGYILSPEKFGG